MSSFQIQNLITNFCKRKKAVVASTLKEHRTIIHDSALLILLVREKQARNGHSNSLREKKGFLRVYHKSVQVLEDLQLKYLSEAQLLEPREILFGQSTIPWSVKFRLPSPQPWVFSPFFAAAAAVAIARREAAASDTSTLITICETQVNR